MTTTIAVVVIAIFLLGVFGIARMAWRLYRGDTQLESGGSMGHQLFDRDKDEKPRDQP